MNIEEIKQILSSWINEGFIEGELSVEPEWYVLWQPEEVEEINRDYELSKYAPGFISFGGNGGGELLVTDQKGEVFYMPAIGLSPEAAIKIAGGFQEFKGYMQQWTKHLTRPATIGRKNTQPGLATLACAGGVMPFKEDKQWY